MNEKPAIRTADRAEITADPAIQIRVETLNAETLDRYLVNLQNGIDLGTLDVFQVDGRLYLANGFHRLEAMDRYNRSEHFDVAVTIHPGDLTDARIFSATANAGHGLPLSKRSNENAMARLLAETDWSFRRIGRELAISDATVRNFNKRHAIRPDDATITVERGGSSYELKPANIGTNGASAQSTQIEPAMNGTGGTSGKHGVCLRCGRKLTNLESVKDGMGPCCAAKAERAAAQEEAKAIADGIDRDLPAFVAPWAPEPWTAGEPEPADRNAIELAMSRYGLVMRIEVRRGRFAAVLEDSDGWGIEGEGSTLAEVLADLAREVSTVFAEEMEVAA